MQLKVAVYVVTFLCIKSRTTSKQVVAWNITEAWLTKTKLYNSILACIKLGWQFLKVDKKKNRDKIMQKINEWRMTMRFLNYLHVYTRSRDSNIGSTFEICKRSSCFLKVKQSQMNLKLCLVLWKSVDRHAHYFFFYHVNYQYLLYKFNTINTAKVYVHRQQFYSAKTNILQLRKR